MTHKEDVEDILRWIAAHPEEEIFETKKESPPSPKPPTIFSPIQTSSSSSSLQEEEEYQPLRWDKKEKDEKEEQKEEETTSTSTSTTPIPPLESGSPDDSHLNPPEVSALLSLAESTRKSDRVERRRRNKTLAASDQVQIDPPDTARLDQHTTPEELHAIIRDVETENVRNALLYQQKKSDLAIGVTPSPPTSGGRVRKRARKQFQGATKKLPYGRNMQNLRKSLARSARNPEKGEKVEFNDF